MATLTFKIVCSDLGQIFIQMCIYIHTFFKKLYKKVKWHLKINFKTLGSILGSSVPDKIFLPKEIFAVLVISSSKSRRLRSKSSWTPQVV